MRNKIKPFPHVDEMPFEVTFENIVAKREIAHNEHFFYNILFNNYAFIKRDFSKENSRGIVIPLASACASSQHFK